MCRGAYRASIRFLLYCGNNQARRKAMSKGQDSKKETKKVPAMTAKEKKAAKKAKKNEKSRMGA